MHEPVAGIAPSQHLTGVALVTGATLAWSTAGLFARHLGLDSWSMLVWRGLFGALGILAVMLVRDRGAAWRGFARLGAAGWLYVATCTVGMTAFIVALDHSSVAHVAIVYATAPFCAAGLGWLFGRERPSASAIAASLAALAGVGIMVGLAPEGSATGTALALAMTLAMAGMIVLARRRPDIPTLPATCLAALATGLVSMPFAAQLALAPAQIFELAAFGLVQSALGIALFMAGSRVLPPVESALITALDAPLAPVWVWLAFGETPGGATLLGGAVVLVAVAAHFVADLSRGGAASRASSPAPGHALKK